MDQTPSRKTAQMKHPYSVIHRNPYSAPPIAVNSATSFLIKEGPPHFFENARADEVVLDVSSGAGVTSFGHSSRKIKDAMVDQIKCMPYHHAGQWTSAPVERAGSAIIDRCGPAFKDGGVSFYSGGSEAVEAAIKAAAQILSNYQTTTPIVARRHSYHGNTMGALLASDHPRKSVAMDHLLLPEIVPEDARFDAFMPSWLSVPDQGLREYEMQCVASLAASLEQMRQDYNGARSIVLIETIAGTTLGIEPPTAAYLQSVRAWCDTFGAVLIHDEILSGNYRTGYLLASQYYRGCEPDIAVLGKGITGGYFPMSAVVLSRDARRMLELTGRLWHTSTNQNHPIGCAAIVAAMESYDECTDEIRRLARHLTLEVMPHIKTLPVVDSVNGVGTLWGVRFDPEVPGLHTKVKEQLLQKGIACYTDGGTVNGKGNMLMFAPPCSIKTDLINQFVEALGEIKF